MKNIIYEKPFLTAMRIFACVASLLLIVVTSLKIYNTFIIKQIPADLQNLLGITENITAIILFYLMIIHPQKIEYLAIGSFMYAIACLALELIDFKTAKAESQGTQKILNLAIYPGLTESDVVLLQKVLENEQYKNIARAVYKAPGTIRNRLNKIDITKPK